jgi:hypothetical protein
MGQAGIEQLKHMFYSKKRGGRMVEGAMKIEALLGLPEGLEVVDGDVANQVITLTIISTQQHPSCPLCAKNQNPRGLCLSFNRGHGSPHGFFKRWRRSAWRPVACSGLV